MKVLIPEAYGRGVRIAGTGVDLPVHVVTNAEVIARGAPFTEDEIVRLTGISERRRIDPAETTSDLAARAGRAAMVAAGVETVDRLVLSTNSPDRLVPSTACVTHGKLGLGQAPAFDLNAACSGFVYALDAGVRAVLTGDDRALVVAAEARSRFLDPEDRATAALFGDGAGAAVLTAGPVGQGLVAIGLGADGRGAESVIVPAGGAREPASHDTVSGRRHRIVMADGPQVYLSAVEGMLETAEALLGALGLGFGDVDRLVPHQANARLVDRLARLARVPADKIVKNVDRYGNMSSASTAVALHELLAGRTLPPGARVLVLAAGAGYTAGAALYVVEGP